jgi:hypothetical protein
VAGVEEVLVPPMTCPTCNEPIYQNNLGYWLGKTWRAWFDPTWRHVATGTVACDDAKLLGLARYDGPEVAAHLETDG